MTHLPDCQCALLQMLSVGVFVLGFFCLFFFPKMMLEKGRACFSGCLKLVVWIFTSVLSGLGFRSATDL